MSSCRVTACDLHGPLEERKSPGGSSWPSGVSRKLSGSRSGYRQAIFKELYPRKFIFAVKSVVDLLLSRLSVAI
jgi:hypothetical protein